MPNRVQYLTWALSLPSFPGSDSDSDSEHSHDSELKPENETSPSVRRNTVLDIGTGPSAIYGLLAVRTFPNCRVVATDADPVAVDCASENIRLNGLDDVIRVCHTPSDSDGKPHFFPAVVREMDPTVVVCNPPFHASPIEDSPPGAPIDADGCAVVDDSFAGTAEQLMTLGGEASFIIALADQSTQMPTVRWFTSLVGRKRDVARIVWHLRNRLNAYSVQSVTLSPGGRTVRWAVAWSFGASRARASVRFPSAWRAELLVTPGRRFAAQLTDEDVASVAELAFLQQGWQECRHSPPSPPPSHHHQRQAACRSLVALNPDDPHSRTPAHAVLHVVRDPARAVFVVHVKTESKGYLTIDCFQETLNRVLVNVTETLNGPHTR